MNCSSKQSDRRPITCPIFRVTKTGKTILALDDVATGRVLLAAAERDINGLLGRSDLSVQTVWQSRAAATNLVAQIVRLAFALDRDGAFDFLLYVTGRGVSYHSQSGYAAVIGRLLSQIEAAVKTNAIQRR